MTSSPPACEMSPAPTPVVGEASVAADPAGGALRILVADDTHVTRVFVTKLLERCGHRVTTVAGGAEAVAAAAAAGFDLVLMDVHMPGMDGLQATQALRSAGFGAPVFALTATLANEDTAVCLAAGMDACLRKPLDLREFADELQRVRPQR